MRAEELAREDNACGYDETVGLGAPTGRHNTQGSRVPSQARYTPGGPSRLVRISQVITQGSRVPFPGLYGAPPPMKQIIFKQRAHDHRTGL